MNFIHKHAWEYLERGIGVPPKANLPEEVGFEGHTAKCHKCQKVYFFPDNPKLPAVEIEGQAA